MSEFSIFDPQLEGEQTPLGIDTEADAFSAIPIDDGVHQAKITVQGGENGFNEGEGRDGKFYSCTVQAEIVAPGSKQDGARVYDPVSTMVLQSTGTNRMAGVQKAIGQPLDSGWSHLKQAQEFFRATQAEPTCRIETRWEARYDTGDKTDSGKAKYRTAIAGQANFPEGENGRKQHVIYVNPKTGDWSKDPKPGYEEVAARANVVRYLPLEG